MIKRLFLALCLGTALGQSACANEAEPTTAEPVFQAPDSSWRDLDPENTLYIDTDHGRIVVELYPEIAPIHVERIKTLAQQSFYDNIVFHRVIKDFMNQTGDPKGDGTGDSSLPDIKGEFTFRRGPEMDVAVFSETKSKIGTGNLSTGFYRALPVATKPIGQAFATKDGKVDAYGLHCKGVTSMARTEDPNSANSQIFLMRDEASHLDAQYSIWGATVMGHENLTKIKVGAVGEDDDFIPDAMNKVRIAADLPQDQQLKIQALRTDSPEFKTYLTANQGKEICDVSVPTRIKN